MGVRSFLTRPHSEKRINCVFRLLIFYRLHNVTYLDSVSLLMGCLRFLLWGCVRSSHAPIQKNAAIACFVYYRFFVYTLLFALIPFSFCRAICIFVIVGYFIPLASS